MKQIENALANNDTAVGQTAKGLFSGIRNWFNAKTGNSLTDAQEQQNQFQMDMSNTAYQRSVRDMKAAGLNPGVLFRAGAGAAASSPEGASAEGTADLGSAIQMMLAGKQAKLLDAQAAKTNAEAGLTDRNAAWVDRLNQKTLDEISSRMKVNDADINVKEYDAALKAAQKAQLEKETEWIDRVNAAKTEADKAKAAYDYAEASISKMEKELGHRLSSSEFLAVVDSIIHALGGDTPAGVVSAVVDAGKDIIRSESAGSEPAKGEVSQRSGTSFANPSAGDIQGLNAFHNALRRKTKRRRYNGGAR